VRSEPIAAPGDGEVVVQAELSAISPGTELLCYRGQLPEEEPLDISIPGLQNSTKYPLKYGYSMVGRITAVGSLVDSAWLGQRVFSFHPHESAFVTTLSSLMPVPSEIPSEDAIFLPNLETAINLVMDAAPMIGEEVLVFGQGIVGLLTTALLRRFPLAHLVTLDAYSLRRQASLELGVDACLDPGADTVQAELARLIPHGADMCIEVSGAAQALNLAIAQTGFSGRIVIGSWYGRKPVSLDLGGRFHRSRIRLISSQVSTIDPVLSGRWDKSRRFALAWKTLAWLRPGRWITHTLPLEQAPQAFELIDQHPAETIQVVLAYAGKK
jgi:2-desacetyl-2-hydroxyethyl bacteriochlorophyllide A dehydrogenase